MILAVFFLLSFLFFSKRKSVVIVYLIILTLNFVHYNISLSYEKKGLSIFTKDLLDDEIVYAKIPSNLAQNYDINVFDYNKYISHASILQVRESGYLSLNGVRVSYVSFIIFKIFGSNFFTLKILISFVFTLLFIEIKKLFLHLGVTNYLSLRYSLLTILIPNLIIRALQIEKDIFLIYLSIWIVNYILENRKIFRLQFLVKIILLFVLRTYLAVILILSKNIFYKKIFVSKSILFQFIISLMIFIFSISSLRILNPEIFQYLVSVKSYSVLNGYTGIIDVSYETTFDIINTFMISLYYFFLSPISVYAIEGSFLWKILILEPLLFFLTPIFLIFYNRKFLDKKSLYCISIAILVSLTTLSFESHFTSTMRKRLIPYILITAVGLSIHHKRQSSKIYEYKK